MYYKDRIHSWGVANESATDWGWGVMKPGSGICQSHYGLMPGDHTYRSFKTAESVFNENIKLNINDYNLRQSIKPDYAIRLYHHNMEDSPDIGY
ncbi:MAG: endo-1,4-beta-xylanase [Victivallales bacterium]|nr:endo-1,4-beta-xylanase [Victivallales bacterium]